ncbi:MAG: PAS domain S-box protein [Variibacter sp.]|nr:PAS domain S-box protein [Variibacter sp.]
MSERPDPTVASGRWRRHGSAFVGLLVPVLAVALAFALRSWLDGLLGDKAIFIAYIPAVVATSLIAGFGSSLIAILLSLALGFFSFDGAPVDPLNSLAYAGLFILAGTTVAVSFEYRRRILARLEAALAVARESQRRAEMSEEQFRSAFEQAAVGIAYWTLDGRWLRFNDGLCDLTGYSRGELDRLDLRAITHPDDVDVDRAAACALAAGELPSYTAEKRLIRKDGQTVWTSQTVSHVRDAEGRPGYYVAIVQDVSARRAAEDALSARTAELETLVDTAPAAIWFTYDRSSCRAAANSYARKLFRLDAAEDEALAELSELPLKHVRLYQNDAPLTDADALPLRRAARGEHVQGEEIEARFDDEKSLCLMVNASPMRDAAGQIVGAVSVCVDITPRKRAELSLRESEERFHIAVDAVPDIVFMQRSDGFYEYINPRFSDLTGLPASEAEGFGWQRAVHSDDLGPLLARWAEAVRRERPWESRHRLRTAEGAFRWVIGRAHPLRAANGDVVRWLGVLTDIHDLVEAVTALDRQTRQLQLALASGRLGTWELDLDAGQVSGNEAFWRDLGLQPQHNRPLAAVFEAIHPEDRDAVQSALSSRSPRNTEFELEVRVGAADGGLRWINLRGRFEKTDEMTRMLGVSSDVTMRRHAELMRTREAQRDIIIHELRHRIENLFPVILSVVGLTAQHYDDVPSYRNALTQRLRALEVTHNLLVRELSEDASIEELVRLELAPYESDDRVSVEGPPLRLAGGAAESFSMIVHELATNAAKHGTLSVPSGQVSVRWRLANVDGSTSKIVFEWTESNGRDIGRIDRRGYGSFIIGLDGPPLLGDSARMDLIPGGLRYTLTMPHAGAGVRCDKGSGSSHLQLLFV